MSVDLLRRSMEAFARETCLVIDDDPVTYQDILNSWNQWDRILEEKRIDHGRVVMVRGVFDRRAVGLMLAVIERRCVYVPVSPTVKDVEGLQRIAEVTDYFDVPEGHYERFDREITHPLTRTLQDLDSPGLVLFSSGTTGEPKASLHNMDSMLRKYTKSGRRLTLVAFLLFDHIGGLNTVLGSLSSGGTLVVPTDRSPDSILRMVERYRVEVLPVSPSFINMLLISKAYERYDLSCLKLVTYGTEPMPQSTLDAAHRALPWVRLKQTYGLSEVGILRSRSRDSDSLWVKLGGDEHHQVEARDGILWIKSEMSMLGYLNAPSPFDENGWFNTEDRVEVDGEYFKILGRATDVINVGGEKVYPNEIEGVILTAPGVREVIVRGEPNPLVGNMVVCYVRKDPDISRTQVERAIRNVCRAKLGKFKRPVKIHFPEKEFYSHRFKKKLH